MSFILLQNRLLDALEGIRSPLVPNMVTTGGFWDELSALDDTTAFVKTASACGLEKLASFSCAPVPWGGESGEASWIRRFEGTPFYQEALDIAEKRLAQDAAQMAQRVETDAIYAKVDTLRNANKEEIEALQEKARALDQKMWAALDASRLAAKQLELKLLHYQVKNTRAAGEKTAALVPSSAAALEQYSGAVNRSIIPTILGASAGALGAIQLQKKRREAGHTGVDATDLLSSSALPIAGAVAGKAGGHLAGQALRGAGKALRDAGAAAREHLLGTTEEVGERLTRGVKNEVKRSFGVEPKPPMSLKEGLKAGLEGEAQRVKSTLRQKLDDLLS